METTIAYLCWVSMFFTAQSAQVDPLHQQAEAEDRATKLYFDDLRESIKSNRIDKFEKLLRKRGTHQRLTCAQSNDKTPTTILGVILSSSVNHGMRLPLVIQALQYEAPINAPINMRGWSPLVMACLLQEYDIMRFLVVLGADKNSRFFTKALEDNLMPKWINQDNLSHIDRSMQVARSIFSTPVDTVYQEMPAWQGCAIRDIVKKRSVEHALETRRSTKSGRLQNYITRKIHESYAVPVDLWSLIIAYSDDRYDPEDSVIIPSSLRHE